MCKKFFRQSDNRESSAQQTGRKSPWRFLFAALAAYGLLELLGSFIAWIAYLMIADPAFHAGEAASIGVIGGADGPTAIFLTTPVWMHYLLPAVILVIGILGYWYLSRLKQK